MLKQMYGLYRPVISTLALLSVVLLLSPSNSFADTITCGSAERTATLAEAEDCITGLGNANTNVVNDGDYFGAEEWTQEGELTDEGTNDFLTIDLTSGSFGESDVEGTWSIDPTFWTIYGEAMITFHVGNGNGDPDHWAFLITPGETSGTWSYEDLDGQGGGLSNFMLFGRGTPTNVPEPVTLVSLGTGLAGLALLLRKRRAR
jgi:hypothetical protein